MDDSNNVTRGAFPSQHLQYPLFPLTPHHPQSSEQQYNVGQPFDSYVMYPCTTFDLEAPMPQPIPPWHPAWFGHNYMQPGGYMTQPPGHRGKAKAPAAAKGGCHRKENFSVAEDKLLCSAFLNVCKDPIVGVNQTGEAYWERIENYFNANNTGKTYRNRGALSKRWAKIQKGVSKFCGCKVEVDRKKPSGTTQQDRIEKVENLFRQLYGKPFKWMHCWEILRNERKWLDSMPGKNKADENEDMLVSPDGAPTSSGPVETEQTRPMGHDSAKKRRSSDSAYSNASSAFIEVMQQIGTSREKKLELYL